MAGHGGYREGGGRPKGSPNKATREIKALAQEFGPTVIVTLAQMSGLVEGHAGAESETARIAAMRELLDRGYGKATQAITGADGGPLELTYVVRAPTPVESADQWLRLHAPSDSRTDTKTDT